MNLKFWVETVNGTELAVDLDIDSFEFQGSILIVDGFNISANISKLQVHDVKVNSCSWGTLGTFKLKMELNVGLAVAAPVIAKKIATLHLPSRLFGRVDLSDLIVAYYDGYLGVGATATFVPPPLPPAPVTANAASRICVRNKAGFVMHWHLKDAYTKETSDETRTYPIDQTECLDIATALPHVKEGEQIKTVIHANAGVTNQAEHVVVYQADPALTTNFTCRGTTLSYHCNDDADEELAGELAQLLADIFSQ